MPALFLTGAHSSRVRKPTPLRAAQRSSTPSSFSRTTSTTSRHKSLAKAVDLAGGDDDDGDSRLDSTGKVLPATTIGHASSALEATDRAPRDMFCEMPERAGMNSTRVAEVLNFRRALPPVVSLAHLHALGGASATQTEREVAALIQSGRLRKMRISGRGTDLGGLSEVLIATRALEAALKGASLPSPIADAFLETLGQHPRSTSLAASLFPPSDLTALIKAGFLVSASLFSSSTRSSSLGASSLVSPASVSRAASGSWAAVGGEAAFENLGGVGMAPRHNSEAQASSNNSGNEVVLSVPNLGAYLRLLFAARTHLLELLGQSKYREAPLDLLRDRWDGAVESDRRASVAKRARGEHAGLLPGQTKKWKEFYGLSFDWTLSECLGAGLVELFETHSVGHGVRVL